MVRALVVAVVAVSWFAAAQQKQRRPPDVEVVETIARRVERKITLDGKVRVTAEKPLRGLVMVFDFHSPEHEVVTTQKTTVDEDLLEAGHEGVYHVEMVDTPRAVEYTVRAVDIHEKDLRVAKPGPYPIE